MSHEFAPEQKETLPSFDEWLAAEETKNPNADKLVVPAHITELPNGVTKRQLGDKPFLLTKAGGRWYCEFKEIRNGLSLEENRAAEKRRAMMRGRSS